MACERVERAALTRAQGRCAHIVARSRRDPALGKLDFFGLVPTGGILQIQVRAANVRLPAVGEGYVGIACGYLLGAFAVEALVKSARHEIYAVGVYEGDEVELRVLVDVLRLLVALGVGAGERADVSEQGGGCYPLVGVVGSREYARALALAEGQITQRTAITLRPKVA